MEHSVLDAPVQQQQELQYAGFWIRVAAMLIDSVVVFAVLMVFIGIAGAIGFGVTGFDQDVSESSVIAVVVILYGGLFIGVILYFVMMESSEKQATIGKMAVGIRVGKANGEKISFANALGRFFAKYLSQLIFYIGYIMVGFDSKKQGLHDKLANTYVYYK